MDEEKHYIDIVGIDKLLDNLHYEVFENLTGERIINDIDWNIES